jgi:uncharacterized protein YceK
MTSVVRQPFPVPRAPRAALAAAIVAAALSGCASTPTVATEAAPGESVATRSTFAWDESGISWPEPAPTAVDAELRALVVDSVREQLVRRGYVENAAAPEFVVSVHATVREIGEQEVCTMRNRVLLSDPGREFEVCRVHSSDAGRTYRQGTLIVFVVDRSRGVLLWQGVAEDAARTVADARGVVRQAVERMFRDFPERAR